AEWESAQRIVACATERYGRVDIVVNNAGILRDRMFHYMSPEEFDAVMKVHLYGAFYVSRAAVTHFRRQESGAFVHMTSTSGLIGSVGQVNYGAAKLGIAGLSRNIAMDMQRYKIRSNCIGPHAFSRMIETVPGQSEEQLKERASRTRPDQVAQLAVFLASDAAAEISGQILGARGNEIYLYGQPRPIRIMHRGDGWTPERLRDHLLPAIRSSLTPLERTRDVYGWDAI
ncbi:MAG: SDR family oxidoreductase, partial [Acetobacteraceae bacterium]|nr:SDR family oxidoreductase [Acetobacteraceae bacterium]